MVVLRLGSALAVLCRGIGPAERQMHDLAAQEALRGATGLPDIAIDRRPSGRPRLRPPYPELGVSLSYRDRLLLVGFDVAGPVGVDIEPAPSADALDGARLAADHFAPGEAAALAACEAPAAAGLFLRLWVAKEAVLKLTGRGVYDGMKLPDLSGSLDDLLRDGSPIRLRESSAHPPVEIGVTRPGGGESDSAPYCALARVWNG